MNSLLCRRWAVGRPDAPRVAVRSASAAEGAAAAVVTAGRAKGRTSPSVNARRMEVMATSSETRSSAGAGADVPRGDQLLSKASSKQRVAYQGLHGAFCEEAVTNALPAWETLPCEGFETVFQALGEYVVERGVVPIENSLAGSLHAVYDLMLRYRVHIVGEVILQVRHNLAVKPGTAKADIKRVVSHPQALMQCDNYLRDLVGVKREEMFDTAAAAKAVAGSASVNKAAICSQRAADIYGLEVIDEDIHDLEDNITRFWIIARDPLLISDDADHLGYKTSIVFSLEEGPGQLFKAMSVFSLRDIDMTKIESRPMRSIPLLSGGVDAEMGRRYNYLFYIDFMGNLSDEAIQNALRHLKEISPFLRVLGSYPIIPNSGSG